MRACHRPVVELLEPKLLFSADLAPLPALADASLAQPALAQQATVQSASATHEIVFIDASVPELETLRRDLDRDIGGKRIKTVEVPGSGVIPRRRFDVSPRSIIAGILSAEP